LSELALLARDRQIQAVRPEHGVRFELKLLGSSELYAEYRLGVVKATDEFHGTVRIDAKTGQLELTFSAADGLPNALQRMARSLLRALFRGHQSTGDWPRRMTRWRDEQAT
jgi:hypothetical protein